MRFSLSFSIVSHFLKGLFYGRKHLVFPAGFRGADGAVHNFWHPRLERFAWGETHAERVAFRFIPWATCFWFAVIACLLLAGTGCQLMTAKELGINNPYVKGEYDPRTGRIKWNSTKDVKIDATHNPETGFIDIHVDSRASDVTLAQGQAAAGLEGVLEVSRLNNQQNLGFAYQTIDRSYSAVEALAPGFFADRQAKRDAKATQPPTSGADALPGLAGAWADVLSGGPIDKSKLPPHLVELLNRLSADWNSKWAGSGQATPGPVVQP